MLINIMDKEYYLKLKIINMKNIDYNENKINAKYLE